MIKAKILIVEDEIIPAENLKKTLKNLGHEVIGPVSNGEKAIQVVQKEPPDLILMDIIIQGQMDGIQTAEKIHNIFDIPIIYLTALSNQATLDRIKATEPVAYICKPINEKELHPTIELALYKHQMEKRLKSKEERFRTLIENLPVGIFRSTPKGRIISVNSALIRMLGFMSSAEILTYSAWDAFLIPDRREELIKKLQVEGFVTDFEGQIQLVDNSKKWVSLNIRAVCEPSNNINYLDGVVEDISIRKQNEIALRKSEEKYRMFLENLNDAAYLADKYGNITYANRMAEKLTGLPIQEIIGKPFLPLFTEESQKKATDVYLKTLAGGNPEFELTFINNRIALFNNEPLRDKTGKIIGVFGTARDITRRKQVEKELKQYQEHLKELVEARTLELKKTNLELEHEIIERKRIEVALQASKQQYRALYEENPSMYFTVNAEGIVLSVNQFGAEQLGYQVQELVGKSLFKIIYEKDRKAVQEYLKTCLQNSSQVYHWEFQKVRKDGIILWVKDTVRPIQNGNSEKVILIVSEDITEVKQARFEKEKLIKQLAKEEKLVTLGQFTAAVAHEINNPLDIILTKLQLLQKNILENRHNSDSLQHVAKIKQQVFRMSHLTGDILNYVKPRSIFFKPVDLNYILSKAIDSLAIYFTGDISIDTRLDCELRMIQGDDLGLEILFKNLILNAIESISNSGNVIISTNVGGPKKIEVSIRDTGVGISKENISQIFKPFFTTKRKVGGTGLGLTICKDIISQHGGFIRIKSKLNQGTTIFVIFQVDHI